MNPWRWLFGAKVRVLRVRPGDIVVLEGCDQLTPAMAKQASEMWIERFPDIDVAVLAGLRLGGVVRKEGAARG